MDRNEINKRKRRRVKCKICGTGISRNNVSRHEESEKHLLMKHIKEKMREILKNKSN